MGLLNEEFTQQDRLFDQSHGTDIKPYKRGQVADVLLGALSGTAKGALSVSNAISRFAER